MPSGGGDANVPAMAGFIAPSLPTFSDDLYGYIRAVNYLVRQFAPDVAAGRRMSGRQERRDGAARYR